LIVIPAEAGIAGRSDALSKTFSKPRSVSCRLFVFGVSVAEKESQNGCADRHLQKTG